MQDLKWVVAVTTAPRKDCTLNLCIESLRNCGWEPIIFAEPDSTPTVLQTIHNEHKLGVWHNWLSSVRFCLNNTSADVIMTVQDDMLFHPDSKKFAEKILWPAEDVGFVSLYTPQHYSFKAHQTVEMRDPGVNRIITRSLWGACALIFPRKILEEVLEHPITNKWLGASIRTKSKTQEIMIRRKNNPSLIANSDTAIGKIMNAMGKTMWFVDPSPTSHIAEFSTIGHGGNDGKRNAYRLADFDKPLEDQVPLPNVITL